MYLTQKNRLRGLKSNEYSIIKKLCHWSKNLYNVTLYTVRKYYEINNKYLNYNSAYHYIKSNKNYKKLPSQVAQQTAKIIDRNFGSFFKILKKKREGVYFKKAHIPHYLKKDGMYLCIFPSQMIRTMEDNTIRLSMSRYISREYNLRYLYFPIPKNIIGHNIKEVRLLPKYNGLFFEIEYVYEKEKIEMELDKDKYLGIDLGLDNFAACIDSTGKSAFIINGRGIKSYNCWWNKRKAKLQAIYATQNIKFGLSLARLSYKRSNKMREFMSQGVHYIIGYCLNNDLGNIVIGELKDIKQNINLGKRNNQNFVCIPYGLFKQKLRSKCELYGIDYHEVDEAYTSQTCWRCGRRRKANRRYRGLYICDKCKGVWNSDINGAINIIKKVAPESVKIGSSGRISRPCRVLCGAV